MRNRFPHGGEVLGAAPANPILAPVLSQDRGLRLSRQRDLLDLQAIQRIPGLVGYWKNDPQYLFEDSAGTTPASTSGTGPVGQWRAVNSTRSVGSEMAGTIPTPTIANNAGTVGVWDSGTATMTNTGATYSGYPHFMFNFGLVVGQAYLVSGVLTGDLSKVSLIRLASSGIANIIPFDPVTGVFSGEVVAAYTHLDVSTNLIPGEHLTFSTLSIKPVTGNHAIQWTTANKPILRKTPTTGIYWADSNTSTSALNVALGNLGSACTVARASAEGVAFTEGVTISSTYNIAPAFSFNSDVAIFNRALTATEKALITRYIQRAVPMLGSNLLPAYDFSDGSAWITLGAVTATTPNSITTSGVGGRYNDKIGTSGRYYAITHTFSKTSGFTHSIRLGGGTTDIGTTTDTSGTVTAVGFMNPSTWTYFRMWAAGTLTISSISHREIL